MSQQLSDNLFKSYLSALLAGDARSCRGIVKDLLAEGAPVKVVYEELFGFSLYRVGELWESGTISVATEHLATATTESLMSLVYPFLFEAPHADRSAVVSCVANEYHQIGGKMVADTFELHGWHGYFLGANTPIKDLLCLIDEKNPDVVALSITVYFSMDSLLQATRAIRSKFSSLPIWVGGQAFRWGGAEQARGIPEVEVLTSLSELEKRLVAGGKKHE